VNLSAKNILLIEDNPGDAFILKKLLTESASESGKTPVSIKHVTLLSDALETLKHNNFEAVILDLTLPDSQGLDSVRKISSASPTTPIIILTGLDDTPTSLEALHQGAQDYLFKSELNVQNIPRSIRYAVERKRTELEKLKESLKTQGTSPALVSTVQSGDIVLNLLNQTLVLVENGTNQIVSLPPREFKLLLYLLKNEGHTVAREEILAHVWSEDDTKPNPRCIDTLVSSLKKKSKTIEARIESIYGAGYRFVKSDEKMNAQVNSRTQAGG
jgi:DNA-binding response OmpR family regulator